VNPSACSEVTNCTFYFVARLLDISVVVVLQTHLRMLEFLGRLMGMAYRTGWASVLDVVAQLSSSAVARQFLGPPPRADHLEGAPRLQVVDVLTIDVLSFCVATAATASRTR
jgi:hypothetical protein